MLNRYSKNSKIREPKFREIIKLFALDIEASKIAELTGISRSSLNDIFKKVRIRIAEYCETQSPFDAGEVEMDESVFVLVEFAVSADEEHLANTLFLA